MAAAQQLLFPDPRPLVERLGSHFFQKVPEAPGIYLMRDAADVVLYVGKAINLRKRLSSYRVANPDRMPRRHLRMVRAVARVDFELCPDERTALSREAEMLLSLRPKFNRAGTWAGPVRFLVFKESGEEFEIGVTETPQDGWTRFGPMNSAALNLRKLIVRLIWRALHPQRSVAEMPAGWHHWKFEASTRIHCGQEISVVSQRVEELLSGKPDRFFEWLTARAGCNSHTFDDLILTEWIEQLQRILARQIALKGLLSH